MMRALSIPGLLVCALLTLGVLLGQPGKPTPNIAVTTYHYDNLRTGWNSHEVLLNPTLAPPVPVDGGFGLLRKVTVDDTVYAQPLVVPGVVIAGGTKPGNHDIVYVVTENNTIFAIDANSGDILLTRNMGPAVARPKGCANNGPRVGIESTPAIDLAHHAMYAMSYTIAAGKPAYLLHVIDLATLADQAPPAVVSATHRLADGSTFTFNAGEQRQRPALLFEDGNIYAAFGSFCDQGSARGWLLAWRAFDLKPLAANILTNVTKNSNLASIWMSGYGVAAVAGHVYFATGNSYRNTFDVHNNPSETVIKISADLTDTLDFFTPHNAGVLDGDLDPPWSGDMDFGSGGVLLLPDQPGSIPRMAAAAGKEGWLYLLNRDHMGRLNPGTDDVLGKYPIGTCLCGQSYYLNRIVSSGGNEVGVWQVYTAPSPGLTKVASIDLGSLIGPWGDGGFFTAISSNGDTNAIIWAVTRHHSHNKQGPPPTLVALQAVPGNPQLKVLFQSPAGNWNVPDTSNDGANSNIVPVVANGHVYVASYRELDIFGFGPPEAFPASPAVTSTPQAGESPVTAIEPPQGDLRNFGAGVITKIQASRFTMKTATGAELQVDAEEAVKRGLSPALAVGRAISVYGSKDAQGVYHAEVIKAADQKKP